MFSYIEVYYNRLIPVPTKVVGHQMGMTQVMWSGV